MTNTTKLMTLVGLLFSGCYTTSITSGVPPKTVAPFAMDRWHHAVVAGIGEVSPPIDLEGNCGDGSWAEIKEEVTVLNVIVSAGTGGIYTPRTYTVTCGAPSATAAKVP